MNLSDNILKQVKNGETSGMQFKERILDRYDIGCEMAALSNSHGGRIVVGVKDKTGDLNPLSYGEVQETVNLLSDIASENVVPSILIEVDSVEVDGGSLVIAVIKEGTNKPYHDNKGIVWVKNGADKRKVFDNNELAEMMTGCGTFAPDEAVVKDARLEDLDKNTIKTFLGNRFGKVLANKGLVGDAFEESTLDEVCSAIANGHDCGRILRNLHLVRSDGKVTIAAMLLLGKYTQRWLPVMTAKCICFVGNSVGGTVFRDKVNDAEMEGNLLHQFETIMDFFTRNLRNIQIGSEFNSIGQLEIPYGCLVEFVVNALVHRSLNLKAPVRIFIFDDRVEIHSPGALPNGLTVEDIENGTSMPRNTFLFNNAIYLLPYTGAGSGITRALGEGIDVVFTNRETAQEFVTTIRRRGSNQVADLDTELRHSDADLDTGLRHSDADLDTGLRHSDTQRLHITKKQKDIVNFCSVPRTTKEILDRVGVSMHTKNRERYITSLVDAGYLEMTNPDNPTASNQKYRRRLNLGREGD